MALLRSSATAWQASLFWILQVFIHCMLLGLVAFDFTIQPDRRTVESGTHLYHPQGSP